MKVLIIDDDFNSSMLLQRLLKPYGVSDIAANGEEGLRSFQGALQEGRPYDLICLDIMMPGLDGQAVLKEIRGIEAQSAILGREGVKIMMTSALNDSKNVFKSFKAECDAYIVKPVDKLKLLKELRALGLLDEMISP